MHGNLLVKAFGEAGAQRLLRSGFKDDGTDPSTWRAFRKPIRSS